MKAPVHIEVVSQNTAWVHGLGPQQTYVWLEKIGVKRQWNAEQKLWMIPRGRVADVVAAAEHDRRDVTVFGAFA